MRTIPSRILLCTLLSLSCVPAFARLQLGMEIRSYGIPSEKTHSFAESVSREVARICLLRKASPNTIVQIEVDGKGKVQQVTLFATRLGPDVTTSLRNELMAHVFKDAPGKTADSLKLKLDFYLKNVDENFPASNSTATSTPGSSAAKSTNSKPLEESDKAFNHEVQRVYDAKLEAAWVLEKLLNDAGFNPYPHCGFRPGRKMEPAIPLETRKKNAQEMIAKGEFQAAAYELTCAAMQPMLSGNLDAAKALVSQAIPLVQKLREENQLDYVNFLVDFSDAILRDNPTGSELLCKQAQEVLTPLKSGTTKARARILNQLASAAGKKGIFVKQEALSKESIGIQLPSPDLKDIELLTVSYELFGEALVGQGKTPQGLTEFRSLRSADAKIASDLDLAQIAGLCALYRDSNAKNPAEATLICRRISEIVVAYKMRLGAEDDVAFASHAFDRLHRYPTFDLRSDSYRSRIPELARFEEPRNDLPLIESLLKSSYLLALKVNKHDADRVRKTLFELLIRNGKSDEAIELFRQTVAFYSAMPGDPDYTVSDLVTSFTQLLNETGNQTKTALVDKYVQDVKLKAAQRRKDLMAASVSPELLKAQESRAKNMMERYRSSSEPTKPYDVNSELYSARALLRSSRLQNKEVDSFIQLATKEVKAGNFDKAKVQEEAAFKVFNDPEFSSAEGSASAYHLVQLSYAYSQSGKLADAERVLRQSIKLCNSSAKPFGMNELGFCVSNLVEKYLPTDADKGLALFQYLVDERVKRFGYDEYAIQWQFDLSKCYLEASYEPSLKARSKELRTKSSKIFEDVLVLADKLMGQNNRLVLGHVQQRCLVLRQHEDLDEADRIEQRSLKK